MFNVTNIILGLLLSSDSDGLTILKTPAPRLENSWAYLLYHQFGTDPHFWQNSIYPLWNHTWNWS